MLVLVNQNDARAVRNKDNVLALYDLMINRKKSAEATAMFLRSDYIQHNPSKRLCPLGLAQHPARQFAGHVLEGGEF